LHLLVRAALGLDQRGRRKKLNVLSFAAFEEDFAPIKAPIKAPI